MAANPDPDELERRIARLRAELREAEDDWDAARARTEIVAESEHEVLAPVPPVTPDEKIALFLQYFAARRDIYPKLWINMKTGKKGYSPACDNEWKPGICEKPRVKCVACPHCRFPPLDARAVDAHLRGRLTLGTYAIRADDTCIFLAADFDGAGWREEVAAYRECGARAGITVAVERSRSGDGAHAWVFFAEPVPAALARRLGTLLLARATAMRPTLPHTAYDRLFPNQDTMPAGGFGNLIALPLAKEPRARGNTLFLDDTLQPHPDPWRYLASVPRLTRAGLLRILGRLMPTLSEPAPEAADSRAPDGGETSTEPFALRADDAALDLSHGRIHPGLLVGEIAVTLDSKVRFPDALPGALTGALRRLATLPNPVFYEKQRMRFPAFDTPRFLFAGEWCDGRLALPRALIDPALALVEQAGGTVAFRDLRHTGTRAPLTFMGELRPEQTAAVRELARHDHGVLCAPPGAGKTVMGCALAARCKTATLVLVHRAVLLDQWRDAAGRFLGLKRKEIGILRGKASRPTGRFDIAMLPSLAARDDMASAFSGYGLVLVDECHHAPAVTFESVLKAYAGRRIYGLTATPARKDRLEKLLFFQCGPVRHTLVPVEPPVPRVVFVRESAITLPPCASPQPPIHELWAALVADTRRLDLIGRDLLTAINEGRHPLVLADRHDYLDRLDAKIAEVAPAARRLRLRGSTGKKARAALLAEISAHEAAGTPFVLLATASLVGEGFDLPRLDTLVLTMPLSFKGRLIQYAGRIHRAHDEKREVRVYDYLDANHAIPRAMFRRRLVGYRQMGYDIRLDASPAAAGLFD